MLNFYFSFLGGRGGATAGDKWEVQEGQAYPGNQEGYLSFRVIDSNGNGCHGICQWQSV